MASLFLFFFSFHFFEKVREKYWFQTLIPPSPDQITCRASSVPTVINLLGTYDLSPELRQYSANWSPCFQVIIFINPYPVLQNDFSGGEKKGIILISCLKFLDYFLIPLSTDTDFIAQNKEPQWHGLGLCLPSSTKPNSSCALCGRLAALIYLISIIFWSPCICWCSLIWILDLVSHVTCFGQWDNSNIDVSGVLKKHLHIFTCILGPLGICPSLLTAGWKAWIRDTCTNHPTSAKSKETFTYVS